jgi:hypothetical protein
MSAIKIKAPTKDKYKEMTLAEAREELYRRDTKVTNEKVDEALTEHRFVRMGTMAAVSLILGLIYKVKPELQSIFGTPVSLDHLAALAGGAGAFLSEDETTAQASEGIANAGIVPILRGLGELVGGFTVK